MLGAIGIDDPQIGVAAISSGIGKAANVDDSFSVGRNLRVSSSLDLKLVHRGQFVQGFLGANRWSKEQTENHGTANSQVETWASHCGDLLAARQLTLGNSLCQGTIVFRSLLKN